MWELDIIMDSTSEPFIIDVNNESSSSNTDSD